MSCEAQVARGKLQDRANKEEKGKGNGSGKVEGRERLERHQARISPSLLFQGPRLGIVRLEPASGPYLPRAETIGPQLEKKGGGEAIGLIDKQKKDHVSPSSLCTKIKEAAAVCLALLVDTSLPLRADSVSAVPAARAVF